VPEPIASAGKLVIDTNVPFAPAEFKDMSGSMVGFDIIGAFVIVKHVAKQ